MQDEGLLSPHPRGNTYLIHFALRTAKVSPMLRRHVNRDVLLHELFEATHAADTLSAAWNGA